MAKVFVVYGPRGAGKTTSIVRLAEALEQRGVAVGGFFQRVTCDDLDRRGYDLVSLRDRTLVLHLARPVSAQDANGTTVCSFSFSEDALAAGRSWLEKDATSSRVLLLDEISKLEVRGQGHAQALRWALALGDDKLLLLSVRGDQLFYVMETFGLHDHIVGFVEVPASDDVLTAQVERVVAMLDDGWEAMAWDVMDCPTPDQVGS